MNFGRWLVWKLQHIRQETIRLLIVGVIAIPYIARKFLEYREKFGLKSGFDILKFLESLFDSEILLAVILLFMCELLAFFLSWFFQKKFEDSTKLTEDYEKLMKQYKRVNLIEYDHACFPGQEIAFRGKDSKPFHFEFNHKKKWKTYAVPTQIAEKYTELMRAHDCSKIYNNINVRLEECKQSGSTVNITYSQTKYYDLLVTNRAMDYPLEVEKRHVVKSVRQIYEPGPFLSPLSRSKLSNHLGFNGFVELADGYFIFIQRSANVSIAKKVWSASVSASYKTEYGLNSRREMSAKYVGNAIRREIMDELKIPVEKNKPLEENIFAFYRDLVEGGKPHFVFYYRVSEPVWTREFFEENFRREYEKRKARQAGRHMTKAEKIKDDMIEDGTLFDFFTLADLKNCTLRADKLTTADGKTYKMQSDGAISLALLLKHFTNVENRTKALLLEWIQKNVRMESEQMPLEKRLSSGEVDHLAKILVKILWGETSIEEAVYASDDFISTEELKRWVDKAQAQYRDALKNSPVWLYK